MRGFLRGNPPGRNIGDGEFHRRRRRRLTSLRCARIDDTGAIRTIGRDVARRFQRGDGRSPLARWKRGSRPEWPPLRISPIFRGASRRSRLLAAEQGERGETHRWVPSELRDSGQPGTVSCARGRDSIWRCRPHARFRGRTEFFPYASGQLSGRVLSTAMDADRSDYQALHEGFGSLLGRLRREWNVLAWPRRESAVLYNQLEQEKRIALIGLGGRSIDLASGRIADPGPYLDVARGGFSRLDQLASDLAQALVDEDRRASSIWSEWEMEGAPPGEVQSVHPDRYPLTFFSVRLLELAVDSQHSTFMVRLRGCCDGSQLNVDAVGRHAQFGPEASLQVQREFALEALSAAVERDTVAADEEIIERGLSDDRVAAFKDLYGVGQSNSDGAVLR